VRLRLAALAATTLLLVAAPSDAGAQKVKKSRDKLTNAEIMESAFRDQDLLAAIRD
jgi:hypothetical protein